MFVYKWSCFKVGMNVWKRWEYKWSCCKVRSKKLGRGERSWFFIGVGGPFSK